MKAAAGRRPVFLLLPLLAYAQVEILLPFNSQVPPVARVSQPYSFRFSPSTFSSPDLNFTYNLVNSPSWLLLDGFSRLLYGTPDTEDTVSSSFTITASSSAGQSSMDGTIVVVNFTAPTPAVDLDTRLLQSGPLAAPSAVLLRPNLPVAITFDNTTFSAGGAPIKIYYATLSDHTPLPAWLSFDTDALTFSGTTPMISAESQTTSIDLIASDVVGFAGSIVTFSIIVAQNLFAFSPQKERLNITTGSFVTFSNLLSQLEFNGVSSTQGQMTVVSATLPHWMQLEDQSLILSGIPPNDVADFEANITVSDKYGDHAVKTLIIHNDDAPVVPLTVPKPGATSQQQAITSGTTSGILSQSKSRRRLSGGVIAGLVVSLVAIAPLLFLVVLCTYRRRKRIVGHEQLSISRPVLADKPQWTTEHVEIRPDPRFTLDVPSRNGMHDTRPETFSSIGEGEMMLRNNATVPCWDGTQSNLPQTNRESMVADNILWPRPSRQSTLISWRRILHNRAQEPRHSASRSSSVIHFPARRSYYAATNAPGAHDDEDDSTLGLSDSQQISARSVTSEDVRSSSLFGLSQVPEDTSLEFLAAETALQRKSVRLVPRSSSFNDQQSFAEKRQSWIRNRASSGVPSVLFTTESRDNNPLPHRIRVSRRLRSVSSSLQPRRRDRSRGLVQSRRLSHLSVMGRRHSGASRSDDSAMYATTESSMTPRDLSEAIRVELALPRQQRNWVLPGEASPTPSLVVSSAVNSPDHPAASVVKLSGVARGGVLGSRDQSAGRTRLVPRGGQLWSQRLDPASRETWRAHVAGKHSSKAVGIEREDKENDILEQGSSGPRETAKGFRRSTFSKVFI